MFNMWQDMPTNLQDFIIFMAYLVPILLIGIVLLYRLSPFTMIKTLLKRYKKINVLIVCILAVCLSISLAIQATAQAYKTAMANVANRFELVITAPGSKIDMMLATVYLKPTATPLLKADIYEQVANDDKVAVVAPIAYGDSYKSYPVIGSTSSFIKYLSDDSVEGQYFTQQHQAIIGAGVDLKIGDTFVPQHGIHDGDDVEVEHEDQHEHEHRDTQVSTSPNAIPTQPLTVTNATVTNTAKEPIIEASDELAHAELTSTSSANDYHTLDYYCPYYEVPTVSNAVFTLSNNNMNYSAVQANHSVLNNRQSSTQPEHDHSEHDHSEHDHSEHDHSEHDHSEHDHSEHDHSEHDHSEHDHSEHDHSEHDHSEHDHSEHDHSEGEHAAHEHSHNVSIKVIGKMPPTNSPWDKAIITPVESVWAIHGLPIGHPPGDDRLGEPFDMDYFAGTPAILVHPKQPFQAYALSNKYTTLESMAFKPPTVLAKLNSQLDDMTDILSRVALLTICLVLSLSIVTIALLGKLFERHFQLLKLLGSPKRFTVSIMWGYVTVLAFVATLLGGLFGSLVSQVLAAYIESQLSVLLQVRFGWTELTLCAMFFCLSSLLGLIPAYTNFGKRKV